MNERNICIGDIYSVTSPSTVSPSSPSSSSPSPPKSPPPLLLQVSLPRQPCFKLNHRFLLKNFAPQTYKLHRTGYYFRVLREGYLQAGDAITLVERKHPEWTIQRIQKYLHHEKDNLEANRALSEIPELGAECRDAFKARVQKALRREQRKIKWREFKVVEKRRETERITAFVLEAAEPTDSNAGDQDDVKPGAHAKVKLGNGLVRAYSIVDGGRNKFQIGVSLDPSKTRGGSKYLHEQVDVGHTLQVNAVSTAGIPIASAASHHIFVAGGVGITAFLSLMEYYHSINYSYILHYAVRSEDEVPFRTRLAQLDSGSGQVVIYSKAAGQRLDVRRIIDDMQWNAQLYFCGPKRLMDEAAKETKAHGIAEKEVHFEAFEADISGDPFEVVVANKGGAVIKVGQEETLLECLEKQFGDGVESSCCVGNCGTCRVELKAGRVDHRGTALTEEEKSTSMLSCVSRGVGCITIEI